MEVRVIEERGRRSIAVRVLSAPGDGRAVELARRISLLDGRVSGYPAGGPERRLVALAGIVLFEVAETRARMLLRSGEELESTLRLCEIETALEGSEFVRVSRQVIVNFALVRTIRPELAGRLTLGLESGCEVLVTRTYVSAIRRRLEMGDSYEKR